MQSLTGDEPDLELGAFGPWVTQLQSRLTGLGYYTGPLDGSYNMLTESAVRLLQSSAGADNDGEMQLFTWQLLLEQEQRSGLEYNHYAGPGNQDWDQPGRRQQGPGWDDQGAQASGYEQVSDDGLLSDDGWWRWDGYQWLAAEGGFGSSTRAAAFDTVSDAGLVSDDGRWRWDGYDWQPAAQDHTGLASYTGLLSDDGRWRWNGREWQAA